MNLTSISLLINALENVNLRIGCEFEAVFVNLTPCPRLEHQIYLVGPPDLSGGKCANRHSGAASGTAGAASGTAGVPPARPRRGLQSHIIRLSVNISRQGRKALRALAGGTPAVPWLFFPLCLCVKNTWIKKPRRQSDTDTGCMYIRKI